MHLRGPSAVVQPLEDAAGNALLWNGEIFGGSAALVQEGCSDTEAMLHALGQCASVPALMAQVHGPWAFVYWHAATSTLWYGRDPLGRRSLLRAEPHGPDGRRRLLLCSVAAPRAGEAAGGAGWAELAADRMNSVRVAGDGSFTAACHVAPALPVAVPLPPALRDDGTDAVAAGRLWSAADADGQAATLRLLRALMGAVRRRVCDVPPPRSAAPPGSGATSSRVAILFSGGIDCMVLAPRDRGVLMISASCTYDGGRFSSRCSRVWRTCACRRASRST